MTLTSIGLRILVTAALCAAPATAAPSRAWSDAEPLSPGLQEPIATLRAAIETWDMDAASNAVDRLRAAAAGPGAEAFVKAYWVGTGCFNAALALRDETGSETQQRSRAAAWEARAVGALEEALILQPDDGECHMMLAVLLGFAIDRNPLRALTLGRRLLRHRKAAKQDAAWNPRVNYLEGVTQFQRATGRAELEEAVRVLKRAEQLFEQEAGSTGPESAPRWGRGHTLMFLGEACEALGKRDEACRWYEQAVRVMPGGKRAERGYQRCRKQTESQ